MTPEEKMRSSGWGDSRKGQGKANASRTQRGKSLVLSVVSSSGKRGVGLGFWVQRGCLPWPARAEPAPSLNSIPSCSGEIRGPVDDIQRGGWRLPGQLLFQEAASRKCRSVYTPRRSGLRLLVLGSCLAYPLVAGPGQSLQPPCGPHWSAPASSSAPEARDQGSPLSSGPKTQVLPSPFPYIPTCSDQ